MRTYGIQVDLNGLRGTGWRDYALRFILGGGITAAAGLVAKECGPVIGGLFLAFPAIFPASATLIEKHEKRKKAKADLDGGSRGIQAAGADAAGAAIGSLGLLLFAAAVWRLIDRWPARTVLPVATLLWLAAAIGAWIARRTFHSRGARRFVAGN